MNVMIIILWSILLIAVSLYVRKTYNKGAEPFNDHLEENEFQLQPKLHLGEAIKLVFFLPMLLLAIIILWQFLYTKQWTASIVFTSIMLISIGLYYWSKKPYN